MHKLILDVATLRIGGKHIINIPQKLHQFHRMVIQQEFSLFNFPHIHHLINQTKNTI